MQGALAHLNLTAQEIQSLRKLAQHLPFGSALRREGHQKVENDRSMGRRQTGMFRHSCAEYDSALHLLLEGKVLSRDWLNPSAIVIVGERESFVHVPQLGTRWRLGDQQGIDNQHISALRQLWYAVFPILLPTLARRWFYRRWQDFVIPYPPIPFAFRTSLNSAGVSYPHEAPALRSRIPPFHRSHAPDHEGIEDRDKPAYGSKQEREA